MGAAPFWCFPESSESCLETVTRRSQLSIHSRRACVKGKSTKPSSSAFDAGRTGRPQFQEPDPKNVQRKESANEKIWVDCSLQVPNSQMGCRMLLSHITASQGEGLFGPAVTSSLAQTALWPHHALNCSMILSFSMDPKWVNHGCL